MFRKTILAACLFWGTSTQAQMTELADMPSSEILAELDYLSSISQPVEVNQIMNGTIEKTFSAISLCEGQPLSTYVEEVNVIVVMIGATTGIVLKPDLDAIHSTLRNQTGCGLARDDIAHLEETLLALGVKNRIETATRLRVEVLNARVVPETEISLQTLSTLDKLMSHVKE